jgi:hypothetical protein
MQLNNCVFMIHSETLATISELTKAELQAKLFEESVNRAGKHMRTIRGTREHEIVKQMLKAGVIIEVPTPVKSVPPFSSFNSISWIPA